MDVLAPDLMWIDGRCYRVPALDSLYTGCDLEKFRDQDLQNEPEDLETYEDDIDDMPEITALSHGKYKMVFSVSRSFLPFIIGSKGATIKRVSKDTSCLIMTPRFTEEQNITITGPGREKVILAWKSINFIIKSSRKKFQITHFVSLPLINNEIKDNFTKFKDLVLSQCNDRGITEDIFNDANRLHLTLAVFILADDKERKLAADKFRKVCNEVAKPMLSSFKPCLLEVKGLNYMNDDPSNVRVLYANVRAADDDKLLQEFCDKINGAFKGFDLAKDDNRESVKIHATLMNTSFLEAKDEMNAENNLIRQKFSNKKETFDATNIMKKFGDFYFGKIELNTLHFSIKSTEDANGYYKPAEVVEL